jgi:hypothetical protein
MYTYCAYFGYNNMLSVSGTTTYSNLDATDASYVAGKSVVSVYGSNMRALGGVMVSAVFS